MAVDYLKNGFKIFKHIIDLFCFDFVGLKGIFVFWTRSLLIGIIQSSMATMAIIVAALLARQISFENSLASNFRH
ncbi:hypothetical protein C414_000080188 [Campylobacter jejuni subsp. jejuni 414]|nr:hypothetical protein C414_000080188 [Campylobacter jejuni subsp. jejuni 414]